MPPKHSSSAPNGQPQPVFVYPTKISRAVPIRRPTNATATASTTAKPPSNLNDSAISNVTQNTQGMNSNVSYAGRGSNVRSFVKPITPRAEDAPQQWRPVVKLPPVTFQADDFPPLPTAAPTPPAEPVVQPQQRTQKLSELQPTQPLPQSQPKATVLQSPVEARRIETSSAPSNQISRSTSQLDIHARTYTPQWLIAASESVAHRRHCCPLNSINYGLYMSTFAGANLLEPVQRRDPPPIGRIPFINATDPNQLTRARYFDYFYECLQNEVAAKAHDMTRLRMFNVQFEPSNLAPHCFTFKIPGVREESPKIDLGDVVLFRQLIPGPNAPQLAASWYAPNGGRDQNQPAPVFTGEEYHAIVWAIKRATEQVVLRIDNLPSISRVGNIHFTIQQHRCIPMWRAIATTSEELQAAPRRIAQSDWLGKMLFPELEYGVMQTRLSKGVFDLHWYDMDLNYHQQKAVDAIIQRSYGDVPYLISGPPGTGKTKTLVETVLQLLRHPPKSITPHLLVCAPSDPAADTIALRLSKHLGPRQLFRLNNWTRTTQEVPGEILGFTYIENDLFSLPDFSKLMNYSVVVTTCADAEMLIQANLTNKSLTGLAMKTLNAISPSAAATFNPVVHWTALLIDEAAQATEPDALIPLSVVNTTMSSESGVDEIMYSPQFIMAGDEYQLGPRLFLPNSPLSVSLFARLFSRPFYAEHPLSRKHGSKRMTADLLPLLRPAFTNLLQNYRSHPAILATSSLLFYSDTLIPESSYRTALTTSYPHWRAPYRWPVMFVQNSSPDAFEDIATTAQGVTGTSLINLGEVDVALKIAKDLLAFQNTGHNGTYDPLQRVLMQREVAIIAPFKAQVARLRKLFRENGYGQVNIGPLEAFQGLESRVVIFCTTRTRLAAPTDPQGVSKFVSEDIGWDRGVIGQSKKFNVAMTRAIEALFVIGDERTLTCTGDECWIQFLSFVGRNQACVFEGQNGRHRFTQQLQKWPVRPSRLEAALKFGVDIGDDMGRVYQIADEVNHSIPSKIKQNTNTRPMNMAEAKFQGLIISNDDRMLSEGIQAENMVRSMGYGDEQTTTFDHNGSRLGPIPQYDGVYDSITQFSPDQALTTAAAQKLSNQSSQNSSHTNSVAAHSGRNSRLANKNNKSNNSYHQVQEDSALAFDRDPLHELEQAENAECATQ